MVAHDVEQEERQQQQRRHHAGDLLLPPQIVVRRPWRCPPDTGTDLGNQDAAPIPDSVPARSPGMNQTLFT